MEIIIFLILIGIFSGLIKGTTGFGSSLVAIPLLALVAYNINDIRTMMITANVVLNAILIYENRNYLQKEIIKKIIPITLFGVILTGVGLYVSEHIDTTIVKYIAGGLIFVAIFNKVFRFNLHIKDSLINRIFFGSLSGLGNGIASIDGPPIVFYLTGIDAEKARFRSTFAVHFFVMGIIGIVLLYFNGSYSITLVQDTFVLLGSLVVGLLIGMVISQKLHQQVFEKVVIIVLIVLGITMFL